MLSRILYGGRISIGLAMLATILAFVIGVVTGLAATIFGGWIDMLFSRVADVVLSVPNLMWALIILSGFGTGAGIIVLTIGLLYSIYVFRVARSVAMNIVVLEYVEAAQAARRGTVLGHPARDPAQRPAAAGGGIRAAVLLRVPVRGGAQLPWPRRPAARCRLGQHGEGKLARHSRGHCRAALSGGGDRAC